MVSARVVLGAERARDKGDKQHNSAFKEQRERRKGESRQETERAILYFGAKWADLAAALQPDTELKVGWQCY